MVPHLEQVALIQLQAVLPEELLLPVTHWLVLVEGEVVRYQVVQPIDWLNIQAQPQLVVLL